MNAETLRDRAAAITWWHTMNLGHGLVTRGQVNPAVDLLPRLHLPDLTGKTVLDIGTWDGFAAFECERRGASRVVGTDSFSWGDELRALWPNATGRAGFDLAREAFDSSVEGVECDVFDLPTQGLGTFDIVLFLGVLYHMRHPLLALEYVAEMAHDLLIVESYIAPHREGDAPSMRFYPGSELNSDPSNWWGPNVPCVKAMLQDVGFTVTDVWTDSVLSRAVFHARRKS